MEESDFSRLGTVVKVETVQLIRVTARTGKGTKEDPNRFETSLWSMDGHHITYEKD